MISQSAQYIIKSTVHSMLPNARVLLFGSMARGDENANSDYDVLVIIPRTLPPMEKVSMMTKINNALVDALNSPVDVLVNSEEEINKKKEITGNIIRWAINEGVEL